MMRQKAKSIQNIIHDNEYGLWFPGGISEYRLNIITRYITVLKEPTHWMLYLNGKRVRTPTESSSHPCFNCGHCIDNGYNTCGNRKCIIDRKKRGLCNGVWNSTWIHKIDRTYVFKKKRKGVFYEQSLCLECQKDIRWLAEYEYDQHVIDYLKIQPKSKVNDVKKIKKISFRTTRGAYGKLRHVIYQRDNYRCLECGATNEEIRLEIDHIVPWAKGGRTELDNLQTLCKDCNRSKHTRIWVGGKTT